MSMNGPLLWLFCAADDVDASEALETAGVSRGCVNLEEVRLVPVAVVESRSIRFLVDGVFGGLPAEAIRLTGANGVDGLTSCCNVLKSGKEAPELDLGKEDPRSAAAAPPPPTLLNSNWLFMLPLLCPVLCPRFNWGVCLGLCVLPPLMGPNPSGVLMRLPMAETTPPNPLPGERLFLINLGRGSLGFTEKIARSLDILCSAKYGSFVVVEVRFK